MPNYFPIQQKIRQTDKLQYNSLYPMNHCARHVKSYMLLATCGSPRERTSTVKQQLMVAPTLKTTGLHYIKSLCLQ